MKFGVREICDVIFRAKKAMTIGSMNVEKDQPVLYFDSLKTSTLEGAATTVYATGGKGNARLIAWEGERTVTFTMEDALLSPIGFAVLSGAGLIEASASKTIQVHTTETVIANESGAIFLTQTPSTNEKATVYYVPLDENGDVTGKFMKVGSGNISGKQILVEGSTTPGNAYFVDYYVDKSEGSTQIEITADKFGGNYYVEASTLFRDTDGQDLPAEFVIPNAKIQSNFSFSMASSGDPSTFTFTMDAFPDNTKFDPSKKVFAAIQIIGEEDTVAGE